jgi:TP53 regulating kinase-like protein
MATALDIDSQRPARLPPPFNHALPDELQLITQGAEALLYRTPFLLPSLSIALKYRPRKSYRHPTLDARLTKSRILAEARVLVRCRREGVHVPAVLGIDWEEGWLGMEWIQGRTVRQCLDEVLKGCESVEDVEGRAECWDLMTRVGRAVARMHEIGVVHGDLTTSNLMLREEERKSAPSDSTPMEAQAQGMSLVEGCESQDGTPARASEEKLKGEIVIIDFGLAMQTVQDEDRAVDLYVLERAFGSTHPQAEGLFKEVLRVYGESFKGAKTVLRRLDDVRLRGRKKSMIG